MSELARKRCVPCRGDVPPLKGEEREEHHLRRTFRFNNFREALKFVNRLGDLAEEEAPLPDIALGWDRAEVTIFTHKIDGLTESDFILAAKVDRL